MKKYFAILMAVLCIFCAGCSGSESNTEIGLGTGNGFYADQIPAAATRVVTCSTCHGDGVCYHCDGEGFRNGRRCSICNGNGYCKSCGGVGSHEVFEINGKDYTICSSCHGYGTCGVCDGTGSIVQQYSTLGRIEKACSLCHGSGNCLTCKGTGLKEIKGF